MNEYIVQSKIKPDKERLKQRIHEIASIYEHPQEVIQWLSSDQQRVGIESQIMEDQVLDKLIEGLPVVEKKLTYAELKGIKE